MEDSLAFHIRWEIGPEDNCFVLKIFALFWILTSSWKYLLHPENIFLVWKYQLYHRENICSILLQMSLFNRKVLQIGVVANLTLLQKYCILNIGNRLGKSGQCVVNVLRRDWLQRASSSLQFVSKYYNIRKFYAFSYELYDTHICILCMCANYAYCNMRGIDDCKRRELDNVSDNKSWRSDNLNSNRFKYWILKSNRIQIWIKIWIQTFM